MVFVDAGEDLVMADGAIMPLNPPFVLVEEEKLEETLDMNVSQWSCDKKLFERVVRTQIDHSAWDHRLSPNPHALTIYLEFIPVHGATPKRFEKCQCEDDDVRFHC